ncbi:MAG: hypothetical protein HOV79_30090 [Hamadaea sp.]|nr:hypothetical protein [Hamadaea sp.]
MAVLDCRGIQQDWDGARRRCRVIADADRLVVVWTFNAPSRLTPTAT